jgi:8-oxo-dGTP pyrophosphatase MutT (NUDIX family)
VDSAGGGCLNPSPGELAIQLPDVAPIRFPREPSSRWRLEYVDVDLFAGVGSPRARIVFPTDCVAVVPLTEAGEVVLVRQYRHGIQLDTLEFPGGGIEVDESPCQAALRELEEETMYTSAEVSALGSHAIWPGLANQRVHFFVAEGCVPLANSQPELDCVFVPLASIDLAELSQTCALAFFLAMGHQAAQSREG